MFSENDESRMSKGRHMEPMKMLSRPGKISGPHRTQIMGLPLNIFNLNEILGGIHQHQSTMIQNWTNFISSNNGALLDIFLFKRK